MIWVVGLRVLSSRIGTIGLRWRTHAGLKQVQDSAFLSYKSRLSPQTKRWPSLRVREAKRLSEICPQAWQRIVHRCCQHRVVEFKNSRALLRVPWVLRVTKLRNLRKLTIWCSICNKLGQSWPKLRKSLIRLEKCSRSNKTKKRSLKCNSKLRALACKTLKSVEMG